MKKYRFIDLIIVFILATTVIFSQKSVNETDKNKYQKIEIAKFDIKKGIEKLTDSSIDVMMFEIVEELKKLDKFKDVTIDTAKPTDLKATDDVKSETAKTTVETISTESILRLVGTVTEYKVGNRTARYLIGLGAGRAKIKAHIKILDSTGKILLERDVDGNLVMGIFGGDANSTTRGLAKEVAKVTLKKFF